MDITDTLLIVGAGNAGAELAVAARQNGWVGTITLIGDETHLPYHRPPLSKAYLAGKADADSLAMRPVAAYAKADVELRLGVPVTAIDRAGKTLSFADGGALDYTKLALCLGGRARPIVVDGIDPAAPPANLHYLRSRADADAIRANLRPGARLVVIGGGYVGLEVAASARGLGAAVTVLEAQPRVLARVTGPEVSAFYEQLHREAGVDVRTGVVVSRIECEEVAPGFTLARAVHTADGSRFAADVLVVGVGGLPNVELAEAAGLEVDGGIVVNEYAQTSDRHIYAAGDCTLHPSAVYGRRLRLESVPNALEQARAAAATLCGKPKAYDSVPWFWSDQYELKLQMAGLSQGHDRFVLRGSMAARSFIAFYLREGRLLAADAVNKPADFMLAKRLILAGRPVDESRLADEAVPLKALLEPAPT
jgi:3-phenylpropionate/trans-cinnamate dioxygenase ferredoxin reductase subunit